MTTDNPDQAGKSWGEAIASAVAELRRIDSYRAWLSAALVLETLEDAEQDDDMRRCLREFRQALTSCGYDMERST